METAKKKNGVVFVLLSALCFSIGGLFLKMVPWSPLAINGGRALISTIIIAAVMAASHHKLILNKQVLLGAFCMLGEMILYVYANKLTTAANAIILQFTAPIFIILFLWVFFHQKPRRLDILTCVVVFIGIIIFFIDGISGGGMLGNLLAVLSGAFYAVVFMLNTFPEGDSLSSMVLAHGMCALIGIPFILQEKDFSFSPVMSVVVLGVVQQGAAFLCLSKGHAPRGRQPGFRTGAHFEPSMGRAVLRRDSELHRPSWGGHRHRRGGVLQPAQCQAGQNRFCGRAGAGARHCQLKEKKKRRGMGFPFFFISQNPAPLLRKPNLPGRGQENMRARCSSLPLRLRGAFYTAIYAPSTFSYMRLKRSFPLWHIERDILFPCAQKAPVIVRASPACKSPF